MSTLLILDLAAKSLALLAVVFALQSLWRSASAAQRSLVWFAAFTCLLVLPLTLLIKPQWTLTREPQVTFTAPLPSQVIAPPTTVTPSSAPRSSVQGRPPAPITTRQAFTVVWIFGAILVVGHRFLGSLSLRRLHKQSPPCLDQRILGEAMRMSDSLGLRRRVRLCSSSTLPVAVTWGIFKPVLMLPAKATEWDDESLSAALLHELAHIRHLDAAARLLATFVCACQWPNLFIWWAAKSWRTAQEQAADDLVLRSGASPQNYALQLLAAARSFQPNNRLRAPALAMARAATLETRLTAIMDPDRNRRHIEGRTLCAAAFAALALFGGLSSMRLQGEPAKALTKPKTPQQLVVIEIKILRLPKTYADLPQEFQSQVNLISAANLDVLLRPLLQRKDTKVISYPRMVTLDRKRVMMRSVVTAPLPDGQPPLPIGQVINVIPTLRQDQIDLAVGINHSEQIGEQKGFPIVSSCVLNTSAAVADQNTAIFILPDSEASTVTGSDEKLIYLITPTRLDARERPGGIDLATRFAPSAAEQTANSIQLPRVQFSDTGFDKAIDYLREQGRQLDPNHKGINIVVPAPAPRVHLDFDLHDATLDEALEHVAMQSGLQLLFQANVAVLRPFEAATPAAGRQPGNEKVGHDSQGR